MTETSSHSRSWLLPTVLAVVVVGLVAIALTRGPVELDPDTAEGTVQEYLLAISDRNYDKALELLHPRWGDICDANDLRNFGRDEFTARLGHNSTTGRVDNFPIEEEFPGRPDLPAATEFVDVTITYGGSGLGSSWDELVVFELVEEDGFFWIVGDPWPYFTWNCQGGF